MKSSHILILFIAIISLSGCQKYVDIRTKGQLIPKETANYRYIMNNSSIMNAGNGYVDFADDNIDIVDSAQQADLANYSPYVNYYLWSEKLYDPSSPDYQWNAYYNIIFNCNVVIDGVLSSTQGTSTEKNQILGEALVNRADAYLGLVRSYSKAYNPSTASNDLGVPLLVTPSTDTPLPRANLSVVYQQILKDLKQAAPLMEPMSQFNSLASRAAAYAVLARVYLEMADYANAEIYADSTLAINNKILDLNTLNGNIPRNIDNPEIIFTKTVTASAAYAPAVIRLSDEILNLLGTADLRYVNFTTDATNANSSYTGRIYSVDMYLQYPEARNCGPTVPEIMLIKAECESRKGNGGAAISILNILRKNRFTPADYVPLATVSADDALFKVLDERRRELLGHGIRWYDLKRLNKESRFAKTINRRYGNNVYTLLPSSNRYVFPIADYYFGFNKQLVQNPR